MSEALKIKPGETFQAKIDWKSFCKCSVCGQPADSGKGIIDHSKIEQCDNGELCYPIKMFCKKCFGELK